MIGAAFIERQARTESPAELRKAVIEESARWARSREPIRIWKSQSEWLGEKTRGKKRR